MADAADALRPVAHARDVPLVVSRPLPPRRPARPRRRPPLGRPAPGPRRARRARQGGDRRRLRPRLAARRADRGRDRRRLRELRASRADRPRRRQHGAARPLRMVVRDDRGPGRRRGRHHRRGGRHARRGRRLRRGRRRALVGAGRPRGGAPGIEAPGGRERGSRDELRRRAHVEAGEDVALDRAAGRGRRAPPAPAPG